MAKNLLGRLKDVLFEIFNFLHVVLRSYGTRLTDRVRCLLYYWKYPLFAKVDCRLFVKYLWDTPFAVSKRYLQARMDSDCYQYGETPIGTMNQVAKKAQISENDHVFELGSGTGRCALFLGITRNCLVTGIEQIDTFVAFAKQVAQNCHLEKINFRQNDFLSTDLSSATVIYLYGTKLKDEEIEQLILGLRTVAYGTKIITVSYSLNEIIQINENSEIQCEKFPVLAIFEAEFFWGKATVFIQQKQ